MASIYVIGLPGCGKTTLGIGLAKELGLEFIDLDEAIELTEGSTISDIFKTKGEDYFRNLERVVLHDTFLKENVLVATGGGGACFFDNIEQINSNGKSLYLKVSVEELYKRLYGKEVEHRPLLKDKTGEELKKEIRFKLENRKKYYEEAHHIVEGDNIQIKDLLFSLES